MTIAHGNPEYDMYGDIDIEQQDPPKKKRHKVGIAIGDSEMTYSYINDDRIQKENRSEKAMASAVTIAVTTSLIDGPLPFGEIVGGLIIGGTASYLYTFGNDDNSSFPEPWYTDRPKDYIPHQPRGFNNRNYFPKGNGNDYLKWIIRAGGGAALGKKLYDGFNPKPQTPQDNTKTVLPNPNLFD